MHEAVWGSMHVEYDVFKEKFDFTPLLKGLPDGHNPCPRWGIVVKGQISIKHNGTEEIVNAGMACYFPPGHSVVAEAGTEVWEFCPVDESKRTLEIIKNNMETVQKKKAEQSNVCSIFFPNVPSRTAGS